MLSSVIYRCFIFFFSFSIILIPGTVKPPVRYRSQTVTYSRSLTRLRRGGVRRAPVAAEGSGELRSPRPSLGRTESAVRPDLRRFLSAVTPEEGGRMAAGRLRLENPQE